MATLFTIESLYQKEQEDISDAIGVLNQDIERQEQRHEEKQSAATSTYL